MWEYKTISQNFGINPNEEITSFLNDEGCDCWEAVSTYWVANDSGYAITMILKRKI